MNRHSIAIVGCGTAGPAAALFLARMGHDVTLFERVQKPDAVGAGILLQPTGLTVLRHLGLLDRVLHFGSRIHRLHGQTPSGRLVLDAHYSNYPRPKDRSPPYAVGIHRGALFQALWDAMRSDGVPVKCGVEIQAMEANDDRRRTLIDAAGNRHGPFTVVVVADGSRSELRGRTGIPSRTSDYQWGALWFIGPDLDRSIRDCLFQVFDGTKKLVGLLPTGRLSGDDTPLLSLFWSIQLSKLDQWRNNPLEDWKSEVLEMAPQAGPLIDLIHHHEQLAVARYCDVRMNRWHSSGLACIGDAAHAMSPQLGQGANLALMDAMELAACLQDHDDVEQALSSYTVRRRAHLSFYQMASRCLMPLFQSSLTPLSWIRDYTFEPVCRLGFFQRQVTLTMAGAKTGLLSHWPHAKAMAYLEG